MKERTIIIQERETKTVLASGQVNDEVCLFEGVWYFSPEVVDMKHLVVTDRTYVCPYKGTCYWIDLEGPTQQAKNVAFTYFRVNPGYEFVKDRIGFFAGRREATIQTEA